MVQHRHNLRKIERYHGNPGSDKKENRGKNRNNFSEERMGVGVDRIE